MDMDFKNLKDKADKYLIKGKKAIHEAVEDAKPVIEKATPIAKMAYNTSKNVIRDGYDKTRKSTKAGAAIGGTAGLIVAGTGGVGIAALGGAIGLPVALVTAIGGAFLGSRYGLAQENKELINKLEKIAEERQLENLSISESEPSVERITGKDAHFKALHDSIDAANNTLCIRSGWITMSVVNEDIYERFKNALDRGVTIYIESGWRKSGQTKAIETKYTLEAKKILRKLIIYSHEKYQNDLSTVKCGRMFVGDVPTHIKEVVVDSEYYISGSNNWLSNGVFSNQEASHIIRLPQIAREIRDETIVSVRTNPSDLHFQTDKT